MENINTTCHRLLRPFLTNQMIAIDATAGNGNDTFFLCTHCSFVYSFDIQKAAITNTMKRCSSFSNLTCIQMSHEYICEIVQQPIDVILFNFGYLPSGNPDIITLPDTSVRALDAAYSLLKKNGKMMLTCYIGHPGGMEEHKAVQDWIQSQETCTYTIYTTEKPNSPILYECTRI